MNILIHDLKDFDESILPGDKQNETVVISDNGNIRPCICCYGCWIKTPGQCVIKDGYDTAGITHSTCGRIDIISRCFYGGYSPFVHNVLDRSIPRLLPYFETRNGETRHKYRYDNNPVIRVYFYGKISDKEKETAGKLVRANGIHHHAQKAEVYFYKDQIELSGNVTFRTNSA